MRISKPSPSMFVACAALVLSATGAAGATGLISGSQIKNHSIHRIKLAADAIPKAGARGATGAAGAPGVAGPAGLTGGFDPSKVKYVLGPDVTVAPGNSGTADAYCPTGAVELGGGLLTDARLIFSGSPTTGGHGWEVTVYNDLTVGADVSAYAVCGSA
jgi:hypothetical protein